ncbi:septum formation family protein [Nocardioides zeae]|uniref:Septum formation-related domain-containing protein n=1 Tax=Nocardioides zeae TaxID=1457234 RepID=A0A6P0HJE1_9ACTN|nr:hypothetical protein [Nocardioides zeae]
MKNIMARRVLAAGFAIAAATTLAACGEDEPTRDADNKITESGEARADAIEVGDCVNEPDGTEFTSVSAVPCDESHDYEIIHEFELDGDEYDEDAIFTQAEETCVDEFETFAGISYDESVLDWDVFYPNDVAWDSGDHSAKCIIFDTEGPVEGSLEGAAR